MRLRVPPVPLAIGSLLILVVVVAYFSGSSSGSVTSPVPTKFSSGGKSFVITDAATDAAQRQEGLMNRQVTNSTIMLFAFPTPGYYQFWMYDTNTSLDMIWLQVNGTLGSVVYLVTSAEPCNASSDCMKFSPTSPASYVLEAKAGFAELNGIHLGSTLVFG